MPEYLKDPMDERSDFSCDEQGYRDYLEMWGDQKTVSGGEFKKRLRYFIKSCNMIHKKRGLRKYQLEFTYYAD